MLALRSADSELLLLLLLSVAFMVGAGVGGGSVTSLPPRNAMRSSGMGFTAAATAAASAAASAASAGSATASVSASANASPCALLPPFEFLLSSLLLPPTRPVLMLVMAAAGFDIEEGDCVVWRYGI